MPALKNEQQELFCLEYLKDLNATKAAERAAYSKKAARQQGSLLLSKPDIQARLKELLDVKLKGTGLAAQAVLDELAQLATSDVRKLFDPESGVMLPIRSIPDDVAKSIASIEIVEEFEGSGRDKVQIGWTRKIKFWDKNKALENLGRYHKLFVDVVKHEGLEGLAERMKKARERTKLK